jgi:hypothetical protein
MGPGKVGVPVDVGRTDACECVGRLVMVDLPDGRSRPVATLKTEFETAEVGFEQARMFLDPGNWPRGSEFWHAMEQRAVSPEGVHRYHETFTTAGRTHWTVEAELDFVFREIPGVLAFTEYKLGEGHPAPGDDVLVDEGSLVVRRVTTGSERVRVTTTKRIKFSGSFGGEGLAMVAGSLGYGEYSREMFLRCAALESEPDDGATPTWRTL